MPLDEAAVELGSSGCQGVVKALRVVAFAPTPQPEKAAALMAIVTTAAAVVS
jgi:hypothetical protein